MFARQGNMLLKGCTTGQKNIMEIAKINCPEDIDNKEKKTSDGYFLILNLGVWQFGVFYYETNRIPFSLVNEPRTVYP